MLSCKFPGGVAELAVTRWWHAKARRRLVQWGEWRAAAAEALGPWPRRKSATAGVAPSPWLRAAAVRGRCAGCRSTDELQRLGVGCGQPSRTGRHLDNCSGSSTGCRFDRGDPGPFSNARSHSSRVACTGSCGSATARSLSRERFLFVKPVAQAAQASRGSELALQRYRREECLELRAALEAPS